MQDAHHVKEEARRLIEELPEGATWSDLARLVIERQRVEEGLVDIDAGIKWTSDEIRDHLGIPKRMSFGQTERSIPSPTPQSSFRCRHG